MWDTVASGQTFVVVLSRTLDALDELEDEELRQQRQQEASKGASVVW